MQRAQPDAVAEALTETAEPVRAECSETASESTRTQRFTARQLLRLTICLCACLRVRVVNQVNLNCWLCERLYEHDTATQISLC